MPLGVAGGGVAAAAGEAAPSCGSAHERGLKSQLSMIKLPHTVPMGPNERQRGQSVGADQHSGHGHGHEGERRHRVPVSATRASRCESSDPEIKKINF